MKTNILPAIRLTLVSLVFFMGIYTLAVYGVAQFAPNNGKGDIIIQGDKKYYANIGQSFTDDKYFYSRPSAVGYNAAGSGGSNKGPSNPDYLKEVQARIDTFASEKNCNGQKYFRRKYSKTHFRKYTKTIIGIIRNRKNKRIKT